MQDEGRRYEAPPARPGVPEASEDELRLLAVREGREGGSSRGHENPLGVVKAADWLSLASYIWPTTSLIGHQHPLACAPVVAFMYDCQMGS